MKLNENSTPKVDCQTCTWLADDGEDHYTYLVCRKRPALSNLRSFPFKKAMPCFQIDFWHSEFAALVDGTDGSYEHALACYRGKYAKESV